MQFEAGLLDPRCLQMYCLLINFQISRIESFSRDFARLSCQAREGHETNFLKKTNRNIPMAQGRLKKTGVRLAISSYCDCYDDEAIDKKELKIRKHQI